MGVVYAPPGAASNVTYGNSEMVGSTDTVSASTTSSTTDTLTVSAQTGILGMWGVDISYTNQDGWSTGNGYTNSISLQTTQGNSISTMGPISSSLGVDHDNDVIYIWLNPVAYGTSIASVPTSTVALTWTGLSSNSCDTNDPAGTPSAFQGVNGCDPNQYPYPDVVGIPVWCLKNPYYPTPSCSQWLPYTSRSWDLSIWGTDPSTGLPLGPGLTMRDYADILQADPFVTLNGNAVNVCHPTYGPGLDPNLSETVSAAPLGSALPGALPLPSGRMNFANLTLSPSFTPASCITPNTSTSMHRFLPYGTVEYPVPGPNGLPSTYGGTFQNSTTKTAQNVATDTHMTSQSKGIGAFGTVQFFSASVNYTVTDATTWQQETSTETLSNSAGSASYSITGPQLSDNYVGPATYNVYLDSVYGTYAFYSDLEPPVTPASLGNIGIAIQTGTTFNPCSPTSTTPCLAITSIPAGTKSALYPVQLTNNSLFPITMVGPAITFSDPGFLLDDADGTDNCSNQVVQPGGTCTANIQFVPTATDAPIANYSANNPTTNTVNANIIAAGTANVSSTSAVAAEQDILVTNYAIVRGIVSGSSQGATLAPLGVCRG
jgi:hypothetical protein